MPDGLTELKKWLKRQREAFEQADPSWLGIDMPGDPWEAFRLGARLANDDVAIMLDKAKAQPLDPADDTLFAEPEGQPPPDLATEDGSWKVWFERPPEGPDGE